MACINQLISLYKYVFEEAIDPRSKEYPLLANPFAVISIIAVYNLFVLKWGPKWMENKKPFELKKLIMTYNIIQVVTCGYICYRGIVLAWGWKYKWVCEPVDYSNSKENLEIIQAFYYFFLTKLLDLCDTVFFVLRKKSNQVTFLHVYHHSLSAFLVWLAVAFIPGGHVTFIGQVNSFVHTVMYFYYFLTLAVPDIRKYQWMKILVTRIQIIQFVIVGIHLMTLLFKSDCDYPKWLAYCILPNIVYMLVLFVRFYIDSYLKAANQKSRNAEKKEDENKSLQKNEMNSPLYPNLKARKSEASIQ